MDWWYGKNGEQTGPVSEIQLRELFKNRELPADTLVWNETLADWQPATEFAPFRVERTVQSQWSTVVAALLIVGGLAAIAGFLQFGTLTKAPDSRTMKEAPARKDLAFVVSADAFDDLSPLAGLDQDTPQYLNLREVDVQDEDLVHVEHLRSLRRLSLKGLGITDEGAARIAKLQRLEILELSHSEVTDAGLAKLAQLPSLRKLSLDENANLTDAGLRVLGDVDALILLSLDFNPQLTNELAIHVGRLTSLEHLFLSRTQLTDEGLAHLQGLTRLQRLYLDETDVTDEGLPALYGMHSLRKLSLSGTHVSQAGAARLRQVLPHCQVVLWDDTAGELSP